LLTIAVIIIHVVVVDIDGFVLSVTFDDVHHISEGEGFVLVV
jgi:hypothetical protein